MALDAARRIEFDFAPAGIIRGDQAAVPLRARHFDGWARAFLAGHPEATVLHLGCCLRHPRPAPRPRPERFNKAVRAAAVTGLVERRRLGARTWRRSTPAPLRDVVERLALEGYEAVPLRTG